MRNQKQVLAKLLAGSRPEEIAQAKATMEALVSPIKTTRSITAARRHSHQAGVGTVQRRDDAKAAFDAARQQYEAAQQAYILAVKGPRVEDIAAAARRL